MRGLLAAGLAAGMAAATPILAQAATQSVVEQATYTLGDNDTRAQGREICLAKLERKALEASGSLVESELDMISSESNGAVNDTAHQHVRSYVGAVVTATGVRDSFRMDGQRIVVDCAATVAFNPDEVRDRLRMARTDNTTKVKVDEQQVRIASLESEVQDLKTRLAQQAQNEAQAQARAQAQLQAQAAQAAQAVQAQVQAQLRAQPQSQTQAQGLEPPPPEAAPRSPVETQPLGQERPLARLADAPPQIQPPPPPPLSRPPSVLGPRVIWNEATPQPAAPADIRAVALRARYLRPGATEIQVVNQLGNPWSAFHEYDRVYSWNYGRVWVTMNHGVVQCVSGRRNPSCQWSTAWR